MHGTRIAAATVLAAALCAGAPASAQSTGSGGSNASAPSAADATRARDLFMQGQRAAQDLRWVEAAQAFEESYRISPRPNTLYNLGLAHRALGHDLRGIEVFEQLLSGGDVDAATRTEVQGFVNEMRADLATLVVNLNPPVERPQITLDDHPANAGEPLQQDPGQHVLAVAAPGYQRHVETLALRHADRRSVNVRLEPEETGGLLSHWWVWALAGAVVAGGVAVGVFALSHEGAADCGTLQTCVSPR